MDVYLFDLEHIVSIQRAHEQPGSQRQAGQDPYDLSELNRQVLQDMARQSGEL